MKNILVAQSGGPSVAINATLAGVIKAANENGYKIYGALNGINGVINDNIINISEESSEETLDILIRTPAMALGSCRKKLPKINDDKKDEYKTILSTLGKYEIKYFFYIGGNDSMDTVNKLDAYLKKIGSDICVIGLPKTIDNDLVCTDHTPGFGSSAKYLVNTINEIICDSKIYPVKNVVIAEIMGRNSGYLTLAAALPRFLGEEAPHIIALPETPFDEKDFIKNIKELLKTHKTVIAVVSEGIKDKNGEYVGKSTKSGLADTFGHIYLSGVGKYLEGLVSSKIGVKVRSVEINILQRCSMNLASKVDLDEGFLIGKTAVNTTIAENCSGVVFLFDRLSNNPYKITIKKIEAKEIANKEKKVPKEWLNVYDPSVMNQIKEYLLPLIQGEVNIIRDENQMPRYKFFI